MVSGKSTEGVGGDALAFIKDSRACEVSHTKEEMMKHAHRFDKP